MKTLTKKYIYEQLAPQQGFNDFVWKPVFVKENGVEYASVYPRGDLKGMLQFMDAYSSEYEAYLSDNEANNGFLHYSLPWNNQAQQKEAWY